MQQQGYLDLALQHVSETTTNQNLRQAVKQLKAPPSHHDDVRFMAMSMAHRTGKLHAASEVFRAQHVDARISEDPLMAETTQVFHETTKAVNALFSRMDEEFSYMDNDEQEAFILARREELAEMKQNIISYDDRYGDLSAALFRTLYEHTGNLDVAQQFVTEGPMAKAFATMDQTMCPDQEARLNFKQRMADVLADVQQQMPKATTPEGQEVIRQALSPDGYAGQMMQTGACSLAYRQQFAVQNELCSFLQQAHEQNVLPAPRAQTQEMGPLLA